MQFTKRLREPIMSGAVTCSVRIWRARTSRWVAGTALVPAR